MILRASRRDTHRDGGKRPTMLKRILTKPDSPQGQCEILRDDC